MYGIFTFIYHKNQPNAGKYTSPTDPMCTYTHKVFGSLRGQPATSGGP